MKSLYSDGLEHLYDAMYQTFINYEEEYHFYSAIIREYKKKSVLEIGCGTGNLASHFIHSELNYSGLDISQDMVNLSQKKNPTGTFVKADILDFKLPRPVESIIITGRTTSYLYTNKNVTSALQAIYNNLTDDGLLCFDFIDASRFIKDIKGGKAITHRADINSKQYSRNSFLIENTQKDNIMFDWEAVYFEGPEDKKQILAQDKSTVRAFTRDEWDVFLHLNNFELIKFIDRKSYAFDTYVVVARKI